MKFYGWKTTRTTKLIENLRIIVDNSRAHSVCLDLPPELGTNMEPTALELALMGYTGCFATIFALTAQKMRTPLRDLEVKLDAIKSEETGTIAEVNLDVEVSTNAPEDRINRILELTKNVRLEKSLRTLELEYDIT